MREEITDWFKSLQDDICQSVQTTDGKGVFQEDLWERDGGGGGRTRILKDGNIIEKGGVNFSAVHGKTPESILKALKLPESDFYATGVSIVMHPKNPMVPIIHMNVRYFEMSDAFANALVELRKNGDVIPEADVYLPDCSNPVMLCARCTLAQPCEH